MYTDQDEVVKQTVKWQPEKYVAILTYLKVSKIKMQVSMDNIWLKIAAKWLY